MTSAAHQFRDRDRRPIYEWAGDNLTLRAPYTKTGPFDVSTSRHFIQPMDAYRDDYCREENILKPVRGGGTLIADVCSAWTRDCDPGPLMYVLQTGDIADDHSLRKLQPLWKSCPNISKMMEVLPPKKIQKNSIEFADGNTFQINGPSVSNLQTNAFRYINLDECWLYDTGRMGDAEGRVGDYLKIELSKILRISQGGSRDFRSLSECEWNRAYHAACIWEWTVQCLACGEYQLPVLGGTRDDGTFYGLRWDRHKTAAGDWDIVKVVPTVRYECQKCGHPMTDCRRTQAEWNRTGKYLLTTPENRRKQSFHWNCIIDFPWSETVELWLNACNAFDRGEIMPKLQFHQKRLAEMMDEEKLLKKGLSLLRVAYEIDSKWAEEEARIMSVDKQSEDKYWWEVRAWSKSRTRQLGFGFCYGGAGVEDIRKKFGVPAARLLIDSAFEPKGDRGVYLLCAQYGWIAVKGDDAVHFVHDEMRNGVRHKILRSWARSVRKDAEISGKRAYCLFVRFSKSMMNQALQGLIDAGRWEQPQALDEMQKEYNLQMASRIKKTEFNKKTGQTIVFWKESRNDHARDTGNIQCVGAMKIGLMPDPATEQLTRSEK